ncbi:ShlB/FhaC/HecB family hemolysin secretion/activation protein [Calothrix sp. FACHB-1219]|uniref:ShlB/FhaC/HecB family hemolysin secretion/activation protein n=1 Tax=unclassified Calothrix TaxID=2619626 RepID=UPI0016854074|nr:MULTISPECIES: ShlB/FhaC/HecB family hemolysin secretion/activation protein [unclassified Calothrix]MBD2202992.1 ShlB/FhaC/HecB family hemolysin secretion/activation protein [Calothrix sp. FACHB-168]MBD2216120.1 ShlB/FhaC/HecB family hemolysin secretion/activation protein [Calothrix sp. FACHB-1219]
MYSLLQKFVTGIVCLFSSSLVIAGIFPNYADAKLATAISTAASNTSLHPNSQPEEKGQGAGGLVLPYRDPFVPNFAGELEIAQATPTPEASPTPDSPPITVTKIDLQGSSFAESAAIQSILKTVEGQTVSLAQLKNIADQITGWYFQQDYITSEAIVDESSIKDGVVRIQVIEGTIEEIQFDPPTKRIHPDYVRSRLGMGTHKPFSPSKLEEQLRLLQIDPLFSKVEASVRPGTNRGQSIVVVRLTEAEPFDLNLSADNYSPPSLGSERLGIGAIYRNLTGIGDQISANYYFTTKSGGSNLYDFSYQVPLNPMNGTLQLRTAINKVKVVQAPFDIFDIRGESSLYEITYRQPIVRSLAQEFALSLGFSVQNGQTFTFAGPTPFGIGPDNDGNSQTRTIRFSQDYVQRSLEGVWGLRSQFNFGIGAFDATINDDPKPDGQFFSWLLQLQRQQKLSQNHLLIAQLDLQLTPNGLLPSQQFVIGGGQSVRGYRQNVRAGDNGLRLSIENRIGLQKDPDNGQDVLQLAPFFDLGYIWNVDSNPNLIQRQKFISGLGLGVLWKPLPDFNLRLDYAVPLIELDDRGTNAQDDGLYFSVGLHL